MNHQYLLKNARLVEGQRDEVGDLFIDGEKIGYADNKIDSGVEVIDCSGCIVMPGAIDPHTHMGIPIKEGSSADNFYTGTRAAIHGGVTSILDFSILGQNESLATSIIHRKEAAQKSICDFGIHCNITRSDKNLLDEIPGLVAQGITSFKVFTTYSNAKLGYDDIEMFAETIASVGGVLMVHSEDDKILQSAASKFTGKGLAEAKYHGMSRPVHSEVEAIKRIGEIARRTNCTIYIVHVSSAEGFAEAKKQGLLIETCPQYLFLDDTCYLRDDGNMFVASPPLRNAESKETLLSGLASNDHMTLGTDHCPFFLDDKSGVKSFENIPNGIGGVETFLPVMLAYFLNNDLNLSRLARLTSMNTAMIFGLFPKKGSLNPGSDADIVIIDPQVDFFAWEKDLMSVTDWCAYKEMPALFPKHVFRRGEWIIRDGDMGSYTSGEFLPMDLPNLEYIDI